MRKKVRSGRVYLVGAGAGDPGLITVKGAEILKQADVVIYDYLVDNAVLKYANPAAEMLCAGELGGKRFSDGFAKRQVMINRLMVNRAKAGKKIVRLKNGTPFIFGRANEEMEALRGNGIKFSVIPGVTAGNAAACCSGIPLTARGISSSVVFATGHEAPEKAGGIIDWKNIAASDTIVLYMAAGNLSGIARQLIASGRKKNTPVAVVSRAGGIGQKLVRGVLRDISARAKKAKISAPAVVIAGETVKSEKKFNWFRKGRKILFTGLSAERFFEKGIIFHVPMIDIRPADNYEELDEWIKKINGFDWIVFSSRFGAIYFFRTLMKRGLDARALNGIKIAAVGSSTAKKLREYGVIADIIPKRESSSGLLGELKKTGVAGAKIFMPRSDIADKGLAAGLEKLGAEVTSCAVYRNVMPGNLPDLDFSFFDEIIFSSPSTVRNFIKRYGKPPGRIRIRSIGHVTGRELKKWGLSV